MRTTVLNHMHTQHPVAQAEFDRLAKVEAGIKLDQARAGEPELEPKRQRMSAPLEARDFDAELEAVQADMDVQREIIATGWVRLVVKGLTRGEYRRLLVEHGPREDDPLDQQLGYNVDSFGEALIRACLVKTLAHELNGGEPVENRWDEWADEMTAGQWEDVFRACLSLTMDPNPSPPLPR